MKQISRSIVKRLRGRRSFKSLEGHDFEELAPGVFLTLPQAEAALVKEHYATAKNVLEYGSGGSTALALKLGVERVVSVESDKTWAQKLGEDLRRAFPGRQFDVLHKDIGPTKDWGYPVNGEGAARYHLYALSVWDDETLTPDVVLIDGRFRGACFYAAALRCRKPTTVLFDDYVDRPQYHHVEALFKPVEIRGRMARFQIEPLSLPIPDVTQMIAAFADPQ